MVALLTEWGIGCEQKQVFDEKVAAGCVVVGVVLLVLFRNRNDLSGCGNRYVMESLGLIKTEVDPALKTSTIFGDLPPVEDDKKPETKTEASNEEKESR